MIDQELEDAIDNAGRSRVFAVVREAGWDHQDMPPKWVWWLAVRRAEQMTDRAAEE